MFRTTYYSTYTAHEEQAKTGSSEQQISFVNVESDSTIVGQKPGYDYSQLDKYGIVKANTELNDKTILIGSASYDTTDPTKKLDTSKTTKKGQLGIVDKTFITDGEEGVRLAKVRVREERVPNIGDKMASRAGQKGTIGLVIPEADMPFSKNGTRPDLIINPGTAGGFNSRGGKIGDIYLPTRVLFHHRDIPMGKFEAYGLGDYKVYGHQKLKESLDFKTGVFSTSDSLTFNDKDQTFFEENKVVIKEMEAASISYVCEMAKVPYLGVKSVTDIVDGGRVTSEEFLENLGTASKNLQVFLKKLINLLLIN